MGHGLGALCVLHSGWADNAEKASAGVLASSDLSAFLRPFARDRLPTPASGGTPDECQCQQFLADVRTTRRAMLTAFGTILSTSPELHGLKAVTADSITVPVKLTNRQSALLLRHLLFPGYGVLAPRAPTMSSTSRSEDILLPSPWLAFLLNELLALGRHALRSSTTSCGTFGARSKLCRQPYSGNEGPPSGGHCVLYHKVGVNLDCDMSAIGDLSSLARTSSVIAPFAATRPEGFSASG